MNLLVILFTWTNLFVLCLGILLGVIMQLRWSEKKSPGLPTRNIWYCHMAGARLIIQDYLNRYEEENAFKIASRMCRQINIFVQSEGYPFELVIVQENVTDVDDVTWVSPVVRIQEVPKVPKYGKA